MTKRRSCGIVFHTHESEGRGPGVESTTQITLERIPNSAPQVTIVETFPDGTTVTPDTSIKSHFLDQAEGRLSPRRSRERR